MNLTSETYPQIGIAVVPINKAYRLQITNIAVDNILAERKDQSDIFNCKIEFSLEQLDTIKQKLTQHYNLKTLNVSDLKINSEYVTEISSNVKVQITKSGDAFLGIKLEQSQAIKTVPLSEAHKYFNITKYKSLLNLTVVLTTERIHEHVIALSCIIRNIKFSGNIYQV